MKAKKKAEELLGKFENYVNERDFFGDNVRLKMQKQCAIIAVDEIIKLDVFDCNDEWSDEDGDTREYWEDVKRYLDSF